MNDIVFKLRQFFASPSHKRTLSLIVILLIIAAVPLTVFVAQKQQEIRQRASGPSDSYISTQSSTLTPPDTGELSPTTEEVSPILALTSSPQSSAPANEDGSPTPTNTPPVSTPTPTSTVSSAIPTTCAPRLKADGNANEDCLINSLDYDIWLQTFGSTTDLRADFDNDRRITIMDFNIWQDHAAF